MAVVGGLLVSQLLTLYITPVIFLSLERIMRRWHERHAPPGPRGLARAA
jgi:Cu/Ag efflux pump CusA